MAKPTPSGGIRPFIEKGNRRDLLHDLSNAPVLDLDTAIDKLISRASDGSDRPKKDGKDGTADGLIGAGKAKDVMEGNDSGKEATDSTGKEATDSTGKEATDGTGKEATDGTGKEATDGTGKEATDGTGKEATDGTGKEATDGTGKEATDDPGKQFKESADDTVRDLRKWHADVINLHDTINSVLNGYFGPKPRDTTVEAPNEVNVSNFTVGNSANGIGRNEVGLPGNLDNDKLKEVQREHDARLDDLIRPDRPII